MNTDQKHLTMIAKAEITAWESTHSSRQPLPRGLAMAILFAFVHRVTTGKTVEETFFKAKSIQPDYEI